MARPSNRDKLLQAGLRVVHERGFGATSVRDVVRAAGVPQGSFTNHWASKEAFGLAVLEAYAAGMERLLARTLRDPALPPIGRMRAYVVALRTETCGTGVECGCLLGNMSAEAGDAGDAIRRRVVDILAAVRAEIASCLETAVAHGALPPATDCEDLACVVLSSLQGAILLAKAQQCPAPMERMERLLFTRILTDGGGVAAMADARA